MGILGELEEPADHADMSRATMKTASNLQIDGEINTGFSEIKGKICEVWDIYAQKQINSNLEYGNPILVLRFSAVNSDRHLNLTVDRYWDSSTSGSISSPSDTLPEMARVSIPPWVVHAQGERKVVFGYNCSIHKFRSYTSHWIKLCRYVNMKWQTLTMVARYFFELGKYYPIFEAIVLSIHYIDDSVHYRFIRFQLRRTDILRRYDGYDTVAALDYIYGKDPTAKVISISPHNKNHKESYIAMHGVGQFQGINSIHCLFLGTALYVPAGADFNLSVVVRMMISPAYYARQLGYRSPTIDIICLRRYTSISYDKQQNDLIYDLEIVLKGKEGLPSEHSRCVLPPMPEPKKEAGKEEVK